MIRILSNWNEIGKATHFLRSKGLPMHGDPEKNWDMVYICEIADRLKRNCEIVDFGCGGLYVLKLLSAMGFSNLYGFDLKIPKQDRLRQLFRCWRNRTVKLPFHLYQRDITNTSFPDARFDFAVSLSVIEHGVNIEKFFSEAYRILKPGSLLLITTDYWDVKVSVNDSVKPFGLSYTVFSQADIERIIGVAKRFGFRLNEDMFIPFCSEKVVEWNMMKYTFISLLLSKD
jgi:SAM-dependent methyltransferase